MERSVRIFFQVALCLVTVGTTVQAQPVAVREIPMVSTNFVSIGNLVYFSAGPDMDLWRTDGTEDGTMMIKSGFTHRPVNFKEFKGTAIFTEGLHKLWRSDGTSSGTVLLATSAQHDIKIFGATDQYVFFSAGDVSSGTELYRTDGTPGGTVMLKDIGPGTDNGFRGATAIVGNTFFFAGNNGTDGTELWKSNGTSAGTVMVKDINPGPANGFFEDTSFRRVPAFSFQDKLYFVGITPTEGIEPWLSDGTVAGTRLLKDIIPGNQGSGISFGGENEGWLYFSSLVYNDDVAEFTLLKTQGTVESTLPVATETPCECRFDGNFLNYKGKLYFTVQRDELISEVWVTDGSAGSTQKIYSEFLDGNIPFFREANDHFFFYTTSQGHPLTLYARDEDSQTMSYDIKSGNTQMAPISIAKAGELLFFADHDGPRVGDSAAPEDFMQAMQTDGETVQSLRDIFGTSFADANNFVGYREKLLFTTGSGSAPMQLWIYDPNNTGGNTDHFTLVNAETDQDIQTINNDDVITLPESVNVNIRFNPVDNPGSVRLAIGGSGTSRLENEAPFSLAGDINGDYNAWTGGGSGNYTLYAYPYSEDGGKGEQGTMAEVHFELVRTSSGDNCTASGTILREQWNNVSGSNVSAIPVNSQPNSTSQLNIFEGPASSQTNFGARIRGYICPPTTGSYTFWIASNDHSELWLSTDDSPSNKVKIAYVTGATTPRQWTKFPTQKSPAITLTAGKRYYIEGLHKQGAGTHNIAVGWQLPDGTLERPIPGTRLSPYSTSANQSPIVLITYPSDGQSFNQPATINIETDASDHEGDLRKVEFFEGSNKLGEDLTSPYSFTWSNVQPGTYSLTARGVDGQGATGTSQTVRITVNEGTGECTASGTITREYWANVSGARVSDIPVNTTPTSTNELTIFEGPSNIGSNYATRIRGYICPPVSGGYNFWIASNDHSELWLSTDDDPSNKVRIAYVEGATGPREWNKFRSQLSTTTIMLTAGKRYYIEALHKQGVGSDNIAVGWQLPDGTMERPIPGTRLSPFEMNSARMASDDDNPMAQEKALYSQINIYPNPVQSGDRELTIAGYERVEEPVETQVEIINMTGEVIYAENISCGENCSTYLMKINEQLVPGVYLVNLKMNGTRLSKRLLVK